MNTLHLGKVHTVLCLGNIGGVVGLLTGFSVISIVEIFYHLLVLIAKLCSRGSK